METRFLELTEYKKNGNIGPEDEAKLQEAAGILRAGGLVAFPTETVYGLGGNGLLKEASRSIYAAKGRPSDNPLILHISDMKELEPITREIPHRARTLAEHFWPGPLTMILNKAEIVPLETTGGLSTVAVRMPEHEVARRLIALAGVPVAAPSANTSGRPSPTTAAHVREDLEGKIEAILDGGPSGIGLESTIVDLSGEEPVLLRPGAITAEMLEESLGERVLLDPALEKPLDPSVHPKAPGMKYRHYAPKAPMVIIQGKAGTFAGEELLRVEEAVDREVDRSLEAGKRTALICSDESLPYYQKRYEGPLAKGQLILRTMGTRNREESIAHNLFSVLREMDEVQAEYIVAEGVNTEAIGYAVMNRMKKAAAQQVIYV